MKSMLLRFWQNHFVLIKLKPLRFCFYSSRNKNWFLIHLFTTRLFCLVGWTVDNPLNEEHCGSIFGWILKQNLLNARLTLQRHIPEGRASTEIDLMHLNVALMNLIKMENWFCALLFMDFPVAVRRKSLNLVCRCMQRTSVSHFFLPESLAFLTSLAKLN